jgi:GMP synthase (glutamine-hydrolysing)
MSPHPSVEVDGSGFFNPLIETGKMHILVVEHSRLVPCGLVGQSIIEQGGMFTAVMPSEGHPFPERTDGYAGLVILGGSQNAEQDDAFPHFLPLLDLIRNFERSEKPVLGICLGAQLLARAYGARIRRLPQPEIGFTAVKRTAAGRNDPVFRHTPESEYLMEWHEDTFDLPSGAQLLATGDYCVNQAFRIGRVGYGVQFHPEVTPDIIRGWVRSHSDFLERNHPDLFDLIEAQMSRHMLNAFTYCRRITPAWLTLVRDSIP